MKYTTTENKLILECSPEEQGELREIAKRSLDHFHFRDHEVESLEGLIANSELDWIDPADTGDPTDAPILGILGKSFSDSERDGFAASTLYGWHRCGLDSYQPILGRWGYPYYKLRSFLKDLMDTGKATFLSSW